MISIFEDNLKNYAFRASNMSWVPTNSTIAVNFNPMMTYLRPSEAEILFWDSHTNREMHKRFLTITRTKRWLLGNGERTHKIDDSGNFKPHIGVCKTFRS